MSGKVITEPHSMPVRLSGEACPVFYIEPQKRCKETGYHPEKTKTLVPMRIFEAEAKPKKEKKVERTVPVILKV